MFLKDLFKKSDTASVKRFMPTVDCINELEKSINELSDTQLKGKSKEFKDRLKSGESLDDILPEAFACVREAACRTLGQRPYDVQLIGGIILHQGNITEMKTGEGKTLVATLPAYLNALEGKGVHIVTVNDYLARRDAVWMGQIYSFLGLSLGVTNNNASYLYDPQHISTKDGKEDDKERDELGSFKIVYDFLRPCEKKEAYAADITYGTNNEFGFDYLRDNIAYNKDDLAQRDFSYAIVDEIDSILIDEARTPLIISAPAQESESLYHTFANVAKNLNIEKDFTVDEKLKAISLTDDGITKVEDTLGIGNIYTEKGIKYVHHLENAVRAKALFKKDKEYVIRNEEVIIVDEFTGRLQPGRRWSEGLHQAIEAKEGLAVQRESRTVASITFQNYFRLYKKLSGMTGTALTSAEEFQKVYNLEVLTVPTNKPIKRIDSNDLIFQTEKGKFEALLQKLKELHKKGQPVLIGTASIEKNELLFNYLKKEGIPHQVLNAKNHEKEAEIIAQAGREGAVTVATNMAGRGVDIVLGGNPPDPKEREKIIKLGGLYVIGTERHEARRIDNQLRGRSGRQGDPGETRFYVSLEDTLMRVFASDAMKNMMGRFGIPENQPIENKIITRSLESAQTKIEGFNFDARKQILEYDSVLNQQRKSIYELRRKLLVGEREAAEHFLEEIIENYPDMKNVIQTKKDELGEDSFFTVAGRIILNVIDMHWMDHLETMDYLRSSVNLRAYGQRDPLVEYKKEGLLLFRDMKLSLNQHVVEIFPTIQKNRYTGNEREEKNTQKINTNQDKMENASVVNQNRKKEEKVWNPPSSKAKVGRNEPCPCGAKKTDGTPIKYKHCHGK